MAVRLFFLLLVLANLIFFAWAQGYLGTPDDGHEPQRLAQQLHPERLRIVPEARTPAAAKDEVVCRLVSGLSLTDAEALNAAVASAGATAKILPVTAPAAYLVVITDLPNQAAVDRKVAELTRRGLKEFSSAAREGGRHELVLGNFPSEPAASEFLQGLTKRGVRSARVDLRQAPTVKASLETRGPAATLLRQLPQLIAAYAGATSDECAPGKP